MAELARVAGAEYLTRPDNSHAKAGNINAALPRTEGELVLMLDADHVPMPDALDAMVGYFDDEQVALVQSPHDFFNHDSVQHYVVGRHEQSLFYRVVCPGKDRHGAAYWCGSAALLRREALLEIGGVATETIAEDFHTTIRMLRHGWTSRYHDEVLVQGLAPHDLDGYLLQRDRWARGNLAVFTLPESPLRARELRPLQRLSYFASLAAYLAPPMRLLLLATLGARAVDRRAADEDQRGRPGGALAAGGQPQPARRLGADPRLHEDRRDRPLRAADDGDLHAGAALRLPPRPHRLQGDAEAGRRRRRASHAVRKLHLVIVAAVVLAGGTALRLLDLAGVGPLPDLPGIAAVIVPLLGLIELRRVLRTLLAVGRRQQRRQIYRFEGDAPGALLRRRGPRRRPPGRRQRGRRRPGARRAGRGRRAPRRPARAGGRRRRVPRGRRQGRDALLPRGRGPPPGRRDDRGDRPGLAHAPDGVVLRRLQPRAPARPAAGGPGAFNRRADRAAARSGPGAGADAQRGARSRVASPHA